MMLSFHQFYFFKWKQLHMFTTQSSLSISEAVLIMKHNISISFLLSYNQAQSYVSLFASSENFSYICSTFFVAKPP